MILSVASGKGGTGKTTVAVNLAISLALAGNPVLFLDCDVEEPNAHIFLKPSVEDERKVFVKVPAVDESKCDFCGECSKFCAFNAMFVVRPSEKMRGKVLIFNELCHGCGGCVLVCPRNAISERNREVGIVKRGRATVPVAESGVSDVNIEIVFGELRLGEPSPVPVVRAVKDALNALKSPSIVVIDAPPGTSCPVVHSVFGSDYCILVSEPTPFGRHDLNLMVDVLRDLKIPFGVVLNRSGVVSTEKSQIHEYCEREDIEILLEIPHERRIAELYAKGIPFVLEMNEWQPKFTEMFEKICERLRHS